MRNCHRPGNGPIRTLTDGRLLEEWGYWNLTLRNCNAWGAAVGAAFEFRKECESEIVRRNMRYTDAAL